MRADFTFCFGTLIFALLLINPFHFDNLKKALKTVILPFAFSFDKQTCFDDKRKKCRGVMIKFAR